jgi:hypothetical protein
LKVKKSWLRSLDLNQQLGRCTESFDPMGQDAASITDPFGCFPKRRLSRYCHGGREKTPENHEQKVNTDGSWLSGFIATA